MYKTRNLAIFAIGVTTLFISFFIYDLSILIFLFYAYTFIIIYTYTDGTLSDPRIFLSAFFTFYSTFFALNVYVTGESLSIIPIDNDIVVSSLKYQLFGLFVFLSSINFIISNDRNISPLKEIEISRKKTTSAFFENSIFIILVSIILVSIFLTNYLGGATKIEIAINNPIKRIADFSFWILTVFVTIKVIEDNKKAIYRQKTVVVSLFLAFLYLLIIGERDLLFRIIFILLIVHSEKKRNIRFSFVLILLILITVILPITQGAKALLITKNSNHITDLQINSVFSSDFLSAGRNFYSLLFYEVRSDISYLAMDFVRAFFPSFLAEEFGVQSTTAWFHSIFRVDNNFSGTTGWGFTLLGQGYLIGGGIGIALICFLYALIIGNIYNMRTKSIYWYVFYLLSLSTSIYVLRADMANLLSQIFKIGALSVYVVYILHKKLT